MSAALALLLAAVEPLAEAPRLLDPREMRVGERVADLAFEDLDGRKGTLAEEAGGGLLVVAMSSAGCPLSRKYAPRLRSIEEEFAGRGVTFLLVSPLPDEPAEPLRAIGLRARIVSGAGLPRALGAVSTTEVFLLDRALTLLYRGAVDDQYGVGYALASPRRPFLRRAIAAALEGEVSEARATSAPGCLLERPAEAPAGPSGATYHGRISRILQERCQECHRPGESGPFPLLTYADAKRRAATIGRVVQQGTMPPWFAGEGSLPMGNDKSLSARDREAIAAWVREGCPEGDPAEAPLPRAWPEGWRMGKPDAVFELPRPVRVPAEGVLPYHRARVPTGYGEDRWVKAVEVRATAPDVVHHALVFLRYPQGHPLHSKRPEDRAGLAGYFANLVPGEAVQTLAEGQAIRLPAGAFLEFQVHYQPNGTPREDRLRIGLRFADAPPAHEVRTTGIFDVEFEIPPHARDHAVSAELRVPFRARLLGLLPHLHLRGKAFRYELVEPSGATRLLLDVPRYDFNWQLYYRLREPLDLEPGSIVRATARYDNSEANPANPDPSAAVRFGEQTFDEMMIGYVVWHALGPR